MVIPSAHPILGIKTPPAAPRLVWLGQPDPEVNPLAALRPLARSLLDGFVTERDYYDRGYQFSARLRAVEDVDNITQHLKRCPPLPRLKLSLRAGDPLTLEHLFAGLTVSAAALELDLDLPRDSIPSFARWLRRCAGLEALALPRVLAADRDYFFRAVEVAVRGHKTLSHVGELDLGNQTHRGIIDTLRRNDQLARRTRRAVFRVLVPARIALRGEQPCPCRTCTRCHPSTLLKLPTPVLRRILHYCADDDVLSAEQFDLLLKHAERKDEWAHVAGVIGNTADGAEARALRDDWLRAGRLWYTGPLER
ncbi:uncharacterized protein LOC62_03G003931 [Vanrija pseudolonga]|uniref:Uncharacterized protein n=1 Tax=Vanrija pseudolonga TaxID=143232 RepID=A0AAF1BQ58_9TREE|nr:hypothetical protein LOC62_03G003931 [Vanrija pseudolonga]